MATKKAQKQSLTTAQQLGSLIKSARDTMRKDKGLNGDLDRLPMLTWIMFLKFLDEVEFEYAWKNEQWHCLEPLSFDLTAAESIREKAHRWLAQITSVKETKETFKVYLFLGEPQLDKLKPAFDKALSILSKMPVEKELIRERDAANFSERFATTVEAH